jgi:hypothetical protein
VIKTDEVKTAAKAWRTLKQRAAKDLEYWKQVGEGLVTIYNRLEADKGGKAPSHKEFGQAVQAAGLDEVPRRTRTAAMTLYRHWDDLPEDITSVHPVAVLSQWRKLEQAELPQPEGESKSKGSDKQGSSDPGEKVEDAEYSDVSEGGDGPAPVDAEVEDEAPTPSNREAQQTSGSSPWWMIQVEKISGIPDSITGIDPDALVSAAKGSDPCEKELTRERVQRIRQRAQEIVDFCDAWEAQREDEAA